MPTDTFADPGLIEMDRAHGNGLRNWHRTDKPNPYEVAGERISDAMWYAYDSGRRLGQYVDAEQRALLDACVAAAAAEPPRRWPFTRGGA